MASPLFFYSLINKKYFYAQKNQLDDSWFLLYLQNYIHVDISLRINFLRCRLSIVLQRVTSQLRCSVSFASQMFSLYQECFSTSKLAPNPSCSILPLPRLVGQALTRLVTVSSMCCHTSTSALSTSSSSRGFTSFEWDISS